MDRQEKRYYLREYRILDAQDDQRRLNAYITGFAKEYRRKFGTATQKDLDLIEEEERESERARNESFARCDQRWFNTRLSEHAGELMLLQEELGVIPSGTVEKCKARAEQKRLNWKLLNHWQLSREVEQEFSLEPWEYKAVYPKHDPRRKVGSHPLDLELRPGLDPYQARDFDKWWNFIE